MASSSSFFITQEEFNLFHSIDRELFSHLVFNLGRDPGESMQVMALWLWLERKGQTQNLVNRMLSLPDTLVNALADEALTCLNCIEQDEFQFSSHDYDNNNIPLIQSLTKSEVSLPFFYANRFSMIHEVTKIVNEVCARAFQDILMYKGVLLENKPHLMPSIVKFEQSLPSFGQIDPRMVNIEAGSSVSRGFVPYNNNDPAAIQRQILNVELSELLSNMNFSTTEEEIKDDQLVPPDDRTIFLTFSKGYPISETEVREFFTGKYGDCIDAIYMQEVQADEQVLFARLVVRSASTIHAVLDGRSKAKFAINGKHVWARKYVRKHPKSLSQAATPPTSQPNSPAAASKP